LINIVLVELTVIVEKPRNDPRTMGTWVETVTVTAAPRVFVDAVSVLPLQLEVAATRVVPLLFSTADGTQ
jgi:hypothetical protein